MHTVSLILELFLVVYVGWHCTTATSSYHRLKQDIAQGDAAARRRSYSTVLYFEAISAALALGALGFDWNRLTPKYLALTGSPIVQWVSSHPEMVRGLLVGTCSGLMLGTVAWIALRLLRNARAKGRAAARSARPASRWLPDFSALIPVTAYERWMFLAVALSAGVCEEVVFRGWLLDALHGQLAISGAWLIVAGAVIFGLAHAYQGAVGMLVTAVLGALLSGLYVATGSLLVPILLHVLIDARIALLPPLNGARSQALPA